MSRNNLRTLRMRRRNNNGEIGASRGEIGKEINRVLRCQTVINQLDFFKF